MGKTLLMITGMSGSGKSIAIKALEDIGFFCTDNLPVVLLPQFLELTEKEMDRVAVVVDVRQPGFRQEQERVLETIFASTVYTPQLLFLDCDDLVLTKRFSESRRPHPMGHGSNAKGIQEERRLLEPFRRAATLRIDTSHLAPHQLRQRLRQQFSHNSTDSPLQVTVMSFGFKHGVPPDADLMFDVRFLPNPYWVPELRPLHGENKEIIEYLEKNEAVTPFLDKLWPLLSFTIEQFQQSDRHVLTVAIGCTGGQHRSVYLASQVRRLLHEAELPHFLMHRDRGKSSLTQDALPSAPLPPTPPRS